MANRIGMAEFELNGKKYELTKNDNGKNTLHGGIDFYNKRIWDVKKRMIHMCICTCKSGWGSGIPGRSENRGILYNHRRK